LLIICNVTNRKPNQINSSLLTLAYLELRTPGNVRKKKKSLFGGKYGHQCDGVFG